MQKSALQTLPFVLMALAALMLSGCLGLEISTGLTGLLGAEALAIYLTRPGPLPPADTADQIAPHESWCYETAGYAECYAHPQMNQSSRLINVDPQSRYPLTKSAYDKTVVDDRNPPVVVPSVIVQPMVVQPATPIIIATPPGDSMPNSPPPDIHETPYDVPVTGAPTGLR